MASLTVLGISLLLLLLLYRYIIYPAFLSPLSKIPNAHFTAPILPLWIRFTKRRNRTGVRTLLALHERHGPVVRLAPNEISVNSADALRTVYIGGFEKHTFYLDAFVNYGTPNLVTMLEHKPHSVQKRMVSNVYSKSYLQSSTDLQMVSNRLIFDRFLPIIQGAHEHGGELDVLDLMQAVGMDFTSAYLFGLSSSTNFIDDVGYRHRWLEEYKTFKIRLPQERANGEMERSCLSMCEAAERFIHSEKVKETSSETQPVVYQRLTQGLQQSAQSDNPSLKPTMVTAASEMLDHLVAGHETSGITLTYLMHELCQRPYLQDRLRSELLTLSPPIIYPASNDDAATTNDDNGVTSLLPSPRSIEALPLLNNLLQETLRLYAAALGQQPRVTPFSPNGTTIGGYSNIPGGVKVSANPYCVHRNAAVFPEPEKWIPERWEVGGEKGEEMKRWFWAFSSGGRMCLGSHFAIQGALCHFFLSCVIDCWGGAGGRGVFFPFFFLIFGRWLLADDVGVDGGAEMKLVVAAVYTNYTTEIVQDEGMEQADTFISGPVGGKLVLRFKRV